MFYVTLSGTIYMPWQPIFFQSIANEYILRLSDGLGLGFGGLISVFIHAFAIQQEALLMASGLGFLDTCLEKWLERYVPPNQKIFRSFHSCL